MALKEVFAPHLGHTVKFGLKPRIAGLPRLHLSDFITHSKLPPIPASYDFSAKAALPLADIYGNDALGDCAVAMMFHLAAVFTGNATGQPYHVTLAQIIAAYSRIGHYVPGDPSTDNGCMMSDVFNDWRTVGLPNGEKILGVISVNEANFADVLAAGFCFENTCFGVGLPDKYVTPFPSGPGYVWGLAGPSDPNNGHAFPGVGAIASGPGAGVKIDSWGMLGTFTPDAIAAYAGPSGGGEMYSVITTDIVAKGQAKAPNGIAWGDLVAAFDAMGGNVPVPAPPAPPSPPAPVPAPTPAPTPPGPPTMTLTLQAAQLFALDKINAAPCGAFSKADAEKLIVDSLAMHWSK
jgi:hypothetical protein